MSTVGEVGRAVERAAKGPWAERLGRLGLVARGVVYGVIGLIALQIAQGGPNRDENANKDGALREIAQQPFGRGLLLVLAVGLGAYALWRLADAGWGKQDEDDERKRTAKRVLSGVKALIYLAFLASALRFVTKGESAGGRSGDQQEESLTARFLDLPAGQLIVGAIGLGLIAAGGYIVYRGIATKFEKRLDTSEMGPIMGRVVDVIGAIGLTARGLLFALAGFVLMKAAADYDPEKAVGLDGTLKLIADQSYGGALLIVVAVGLLAYGLYSFAEARYREL